MRRNRLPWSRLRVLRIFFGHKIDGAKPAKKNKSLVGLD